MAAVRGGEPREVRRPRGLGRRGGRAVALGRGGELATEGGPQRVERRIGQRTAACRELILGGEQLIARDAAAQLGGDRLARRAHRAVERPGRLGAERLGPAPAQREHLAELGQRGRAGAAQLEDAQPHEVVARGVAALAERGVAGRLL